jgi:hypothetical protein
MADFFLTPEPSNGEKHCETFDLTDENDTTNTRNIPPSALGVSKTGTPIVANKTTAIYDITSPIEMRMGDETVDSAFSTPSLKADTECSDSPTAPPPTDMSSAEKRQQEQDESERLAWQLMEEESMNAYQMQVDYMRANPDLFSEDDLRAVGAVLQQQGGGGEEESGSEFDDEEEGEGEEGGVQEDNSQEWTYEQLLELGNTIGGEC